MKKIFILAFVLTSFFACQKDIVRETPGVDNPSFVTDDNFDYAADEAAFLADDTDAEEMAQTDYQSEVASKMKILYVTAIDSLPYWKDNDPTTGKKQKFGRRQVLYTEGSTTFRIVGYGFKAQSDTSKVHATIKTDSLIPCQITSWSDSVIVVEVPALSISAHILKQFSLKFRVFRSNDKLNKLPVSRVKSRACISQTQASLYLITSNEPEFLNATQIADKLLAIRIAQGFQGLPTTNFVPFCSNGNRSNGWPKVGDILGEFGDDGYRKRIVLESKYVPGSPPTYKVWVGDSHKDSRIQSSANIIDQEPNGTTIDYCRLENCKAKNADGSLRWGTNEIKVNSFSR